MGRYKITKILNNNVVIALRNDESVILIGKAIGFDYKKGDILPEDRVENVFEKKSTDKNYDEVLKSIDKSIVGISEEVINMCESRLHKKLNSAIHVSLPDHINFAIKRYKEGIFIENPFISEISALYPEEYKLAINALNIINDKFEVELPDSETGFICMHIRASIEEKNVSETLEYTKKIGSIIKVISKLMKKDINKNTFEYMRLVTHINFMIDRVRKGKTIKNCLIDSIKKELYNEYDVAMKLSFVIENTFSVKLPEDEIGYLAMHLKRIEYL